MTDMTQVTGRWVHSSEEDHDGLLVYRRPDFPFPPARGRRGVEFNDDGTVTEYGIGRDDRSQARPAGRWEQQPDGMTVIRTDTAAGTRRVVRAEPDLVEIDGGGS